MGSGGFVDDNYVEATGHRCGYDKVSKGGNADCML
jgi:hypothetical protein